MESKPIAVHVGCLPWRHEWRPVSSSQSRGIYGKLTRVLCQCAHCRQTDTFNLPGHRRVWQIHALHAVALRLAMKNPPPAAKRRKGTARLSSGPRGKS